VTGYLASPLVPAGWPSIVGIVNITEDSFSDGSRYLAAEDALAHARQLRSAGADIIELGPAASHPDAARVTDDSQRRRLAPVIEQLTAQNVPVSVDSLAPQGADYIRTHDVAALHDALTILTAIAGQAAPCRTIESHLHANPAPVRYAPRSQ
jgi:dihydropteroate synthase type 2